MPKTHPRGYQIGRKTGSSPRAPRAVTLAAADADPAAAVSTTTTVDTVPEPGTALVSAPRQLVGSALSNPHVAQTTGQPRSLGAIPFLNKMTWGLGRIYLTADWLVTAEYIVRASGLNGRILKRDDPALEIVPRIPDALAARVAARMAPRADSPTFVRTPLTIDLPEEELGYAATFAGRVYTDGATFVVVRDGWAQVCTDPAELRYASFVDPERAGPTWLTDGHRFALQTVTLTPALHAQLRTFGTMVARATARHERAIRGVQSSADAAPAAATAPVEPAEPTTAPTTPAARKRSRKRS